jgi:uncharacterized membrane protein YhfC
MLQTAFIILAIELGVIWWVRRRYGSRDRVALGKPTQPTATRA